MLMLQIYSTVQMSESLLYLYFFLYYKKKNNLVHKTEFFRSGWKQLNFLGWKTSGYYYWDENQARKKTYWGCEEVKCSPTKKKKNTFSTGYRPNPSEFEHACYIHSRMSPLLFPDAVQPRQIWTSYAETCRQISDDTCVCLCMSPHVYTSKDPSHFPLEFHWKAAELFFYKVTHGPKATPGYHNIIHRL